MIWIWLLACDEAPPLAHDTASAVTVEAAPLMLRLPLEDASQFSLVMGVDHDPVVYGEGAEAWQCANYEGLAFPRCYDEHLGSDFILEGGFPAMDAGSVAVVAAAAGVVTLTDDGHYDRCHADLATGAVDCDGHEMNANEVTIEHAGGYQTRYLHLMKDSVAVSVGQEVSAGTVLGYVGSSGNSSMPHLHLQLEDAEGSVIDPYAGPMSQPESWWCEQGPSDGMPGLCDE